MMVVCVVLGSYLSGLWLARPFGPREDWKLLVRSLVLALSMVSTIGTLLYWETFGPPASSSSSAAAAALVDEFEQTSVTLGIGWVLFACLVLLLALFVGVLGYSVIRTAQLRHRIRSKLGSRLSQSDPHMVERILERAELSCEWHAFYHFFSPPLACDWFPARGDCVQQPCSLADRLRVQRTRWQWWTSWWRSVWQPSGSDSPRIRCVRAGEVSV